MRFKYQVYLSELPNCPPSDYERKNIQAFRFVFADLSLENNFLPVLLQNPKRSFSDDEATCQAYGLSLFDTLENARKRYFTLKKSFRKIDKVIGTHIAEGSIEEDDGVVSKINSYGHFCLHEFEQTDLWVKFRLVMKIYDDGTS